MAIRQYWEGTEKDLDAPRANHRIVESRMLALERALERICEEYGLDVESVLQHARASRVEPIDSTTTPDDEYQTQVFTDLLAFIRGV